MRFTIALAQAGFPENADVLAQAQAWASRAKNAGADLLVFPENQMLPRDDADTGILAESLGGPFAHAIRSIAASHGLWIAHTMYERDGCGALPFNTAVLVDDAGHQVAVYRKCHLYDAHGVLESDRYSKGNVLPRAIDTPFGRIALAICYDLRFPEAARSCAIQGCDLLLYPAAWHAGPCKLEHWQMLLRARAIENELFVAGVCHAGTRYSGASMVVDPLGRVLAQADGDSAGNAPEDLVVCTIDTDEVARARDAMPVLQHRRVDLY